LAAPLLEQSGGWRSLWLATMAVLLAAGVWTWSQRSAYRQRLGTAAAAIPAASLGAARAALARSLPWLLGLAMTSWTVQHYALIIWLPTYLQEQRGMDVQSAALLAALMVLVNVPANLIGGLLLQRQVKRGTLIAAA